MAETVLAKMAVQIAADTANFTKGLNTVEGKLTSFSSGLANIAKTVGAVFAIEKVASFAFEVAKLAGEAEGVKGAFDKLPDSIQLMSDLKEATHGTVSELDLMKRTVQATNFGISLESLPKLLEFASLRAQQTGQSVDYLVDSIVTGIGRKSPLILDNLGISAISLKEKMNGVAIATASVGEVADAVGKIASDGLAKMGQFSENTSSKVQKLSASWDNFKVVLGNVVNQSGILQGTLDGVSKVLTSISDFQNGNGSNFELLTAAISKGDSDNVKFYVENFRKLREELGKPIRTDNVQDFIKQYKLTSSQADRLLDLIKIINGEAGKTNVKPLKVVDPVQITNLEKLQEDLKSLNEEFAITDINDQKHLTTLGQQIISINSQIKKLEELRKAREKSQPPPDTIESYQAAIKDLNDQIEKTNVTDISRLRILNAQVDGYNEIIKKVQGLGSALQNLEAPTFSVKPLEGKNALVDFSEINDKQATDKYFDDLEKTLLKNGDKLNKASQKIAIGVSGPITQGVSSIAEALGNAFAGVGNFGESVLNAVLGFAKQLGEILIATGVGVIAADLLLNSPYTAIAAGVALVALATGAQAAIKKSHSSNIGGAGAIPAIGSQAVTRFDGGSGSSGSEVTFRIDGTQLVGVLANQGNKNGRIRG